MATSYVRHIIQNQVYTRKQVELMEISEVMLVPKFKLTLWIIHLSTEVRDVWNLIYSLPYFTLGSLNWFAVYEFRCMLPQ